MREELVEQLTTAKERLVAATLQAQAARADSLAAQMSALLESLGEGVLIVNSAGRIVLRNQAATDITGLGDEGLQRLLTERRGPILRSDGTPLPFAEWPTPERQGASGSATRRSSSAARDGTRRRLIYSGNSVRNEEGNVVLA